MSVETLRKALPGLMAVYVFGSQANGTATESSDVDLAVLVAGYADPLVLWNLASDLSGVFHKEVDLVDLRLASTVMQHQIITKGTRLWSASLAVDLFECFVLSEKTALDTARADLLKEVATRGVVYG